MSSKKFDWITAKEVVGGFIRFVVMAYISMSQIFELKDVKHIIDVQKINDWRVIIAMYAPHTIIIIISIIAYMRLGIKTTDAHATKLSAQLKIAGNEISGQYESAKKD